MLVIGIREVNRTDAVSAFVKLWDNCNPVTRGRKIQGIIRAWEGHLTQTGEVHEGLLKNAKYIERGRRRCHEIVGQARSINQIAER